MKECPDCGSIFSGELEEMGLWLHRSKRPRCNEGDREASGKSSDGLGETEDASHRHGPQCNDGPCKEA